MDDDPLIREKIFHSAVREYIVFLLLFIMLYGASYLLTSMYKKKKDDMYSDEEDALVFRISLWMCNFSLAVSFGSALLLPISIITNEVLLLYPQSYYVQWLNDSLIQGLWNVIFLFSNAGVFVLLPFAYLFTESEGLPGSRKGIAARVYETSLVLFLLSLVLVGTAYMTSALLECGRSGIMSFFNIWTCYLPFLYSCVSCLGVFTLLICTPVGFARLFSVIGNLIIKPKFFSDLHEDVYIAQLEEFSLKQKLPTEMTNGTTKPGLVRNGVDRQYMQLEPYNEQESAIEQKLLDLELERQTLEQQQNASLLRRNLCYPLVMLLLLFLTAFQVIVVVQNTLEILVGIKHVPLYSPKFTLGITSLSALGPLGAAIEIVLILYLWLASIVGFYTLPLLSRLKPNLCDTSMTQIIGNSAVLLILSSALPVLARILGITNFDLMGDFGRIEWLGNIYLVLFYNFIFASATALCLVTTFTSPMRQVLLARLSDLRFWRSHAMATKKLL